MANKFDNPLDEDVNDRAVIGNNNPPPPSPIDDAREEYKKLSEFLARVPAITDEAAAKEAKLFADRAKATLKTLEDARSKEADPIYAAWKDARAKFEKPLTSLEKLKKELDGRLTAYAKADKARREAEAAEAAKAAAEAERLAREAEAAEREAIENAKQGEFTDVGAATAETDQKFAEFEQASRFAARAEKNTKVRIGGGFDKALSLRTVKTLVLDDATKAIAAIGPNEKITEAILSAARAYRKEHGELPAGVSEIEDEKI